MAPNIVIIGKKQEKMLWKWLQLEVHLKKIEYHKKS